MQKKNSYEAFYGIFAYITIHCLQGHEWEKDV